MAVERLPFGLPDDFAGQLGYTVDFVRSQVEAAREALRRHPEWGYPPEVVGDRGTRRLVAFYWEESGDELAYSDGIGGGAGVLNNYAWLDWLRSISLPTLLRWDLGAADSFARHWLIVDLLTNRGYVVDAIQALEIVRAQDVAALEGAT